MKVTPINNADYKSKEPNNNGNVKKSNVKKKKTYNLNYDGVVIPLTKEEAFGYVRLKRGHAPAEYMRSFIKSAFEKHKDELILSNIEKLAKKVKDKTVKNAKTYKVTIGDVSTILPETQYKEFLRIYNQIEKDKTMDEFDKVDLEADVLQRIIDINNKTTKVNTKIPTKTTTKHNEQDTEHGDANGGTTGAGNKTVAKKKPKPAKPKTYKININGEKFVLNEKQYAEYQKKTAAIEADKSIDVFDKADKEEEVLRNIASKKAATPASQAPGNKSATSDPLKTTAKLNKPIINVNPGKDTVAHGHLDNIHKATKENTKLMDKSVSIQDKTYQKISQLVELQTQALKKTGTDGQTTHPVTHNTHTTPSKHQEQDHGPVMHHSSKHF